MAFLPHKQRAIAIPAHCFGALGSLTPVVVRHAQYEAPLPFIVKVYQLRRPSKVATLRNFVTGLGVMRVSICHTQRMGRRRAAATLGGLKDSAPTSELGGTGGKKPASMAVASLLASFYPKFENETAESEVRHQMENAVAAGNAVLEVSVKHSGSLFMWSGAHRGAFSKNSYGNEYSAAGVWVFAETLRRAWGVEAATKQKALNDFVEAQKLCIAMELVTAVLGDHGQRPKEDYVVVTAVVDLKGKPRFFATPEVVQLCREWRLPSNQYWLFSSRQSVSRFMAAYGALSEKGTAATVEETLSRIADVVVPATARHRELQGEIMEGVVVRLVSPHSAARMQNVLSRHPLSPEQQARAAGAGQHLREIYEKLPDEGERTNFLLDQAGPAICSKAEWDAVGGEDDEGDDGEVNTSSRVEEARLLNLFLTSPPADEVTKKLHDVIVLCKSVKAPVRFKCKPKGVPLHKLELRELPNGSLRVGPVPENRGGSATHDVLHHFTITVHALHDSAFRKYSNKMSADDWALYRGFFLEVLIVSPGQVAASWGGPNGPATGSKARSKEEQQEEGPSELARAFAEQAHLGPLSHPAVDGTDSCECSTASELDKALAAPAGTVFVPDEVEPLMLKMKFLCYKLRTFFIRNGLRALASSRAEYRAHYQRQLKTWGVSRSKSAEVSKLCEAWADYFEGLKGRVATSNYLDAVEPFLEEYAQRSRANARLVGALHHDVGGRAGTSSAGELGEEDDEAHEQNSVVAPAPAPSKPSQKGILLFFPGIPGCAKSALCERLAAAGHLDGDSRKFDILTGDMTKGKYWPTLRARRKGKEGVITLADKNAPNSDAWDVVESICEATDALGVPVLPDSKGMEDNPFDMETLAVFIFRVMQRRNHPGHLDGTSEKVASVLFQFHGLYDHMDRCDLETQLLGKFGTIIRMPVLKKDRDEMPRPVVEALEQCRDWLRELPPAVKRKLGVREWRPWEDRLKSVLFSHANHLNSIQVPLEDMVASVRQQLTDIVNGRAHVEDVAESAPGRRQAFSGAVQLASILVPEEHLRHVLSQVSHVNKEAAGFLAQAQPASGTQLSKGHITLAHKRSHGVAAVASFASFLGQEVDLVITGLLFDERTAALAVDWSEERKEQGIRSLNPFPHITIWVNDGAKAMEANALADRAASGDATAIQLPNPLHTAGTVSFL